MAGVTQGNSILANDLGLTNDLGSFHILLANDLKSFYIDWLMTWDHST